MESRSQGWRDRRGRASGAEPDRSARRRRGRRFPLLRRQAARAFPGERPGRRCADAQRPGPQDSRLPTAKRWSRPSSTFSAPITVSIAVSAALAPRASTTIVPYTPAWQEPITGVAADKAIAVARGFAETAEKTKGRAMVIIGAGMNHWYHQDMGYRSIINMLMMCGTIGVSGGGWAHYVGQEKLRPQTGWTMLAFALDWVRPPRHMNGTSFFYAHSDQWRYEKLDVAELLSPLADPAPYRGSLIDLNVKAERMGWLPSAPQLGVNPLTIAAEAERAGASVKDHVVAGLKSGALTMACEDPDNPDQLPAQPLHLALEPVRLLREGPRIFPQAFPRHPSRAAGQGPRRDGREEAGGGRLARSGAGGKARSRRHPRLPHVDELPLLRRRAANRDLVREERPQHVRHASLHPSAFRGGGPRLGSAQRLGDVQDHRAPLLGTRRRSSRYRARRGARRRSSTTLPASLPNPSRSRIGRRENAISSPASPRRRSPSSSATIPTPIAVSLRSDRSPTSSAMAARASRGTRSMR